MVLSVKSSSPREVIIDDLQVSRSISLAGANYDQRLTEVKPNNFLTFNVWLEAENKKNIPIPFAYKDSADNFFNQLRVNNQVIHIPTPCWNMSYIGTLCQQADKSLRNELKAWGITEEIIALLKNQNKLGNLKLSDNLKSILYEHRNADKAAIDFAFNHYFEPTGRV